MRPYRYLLLLLLTLLVAHVSSAQVATGTPPFGSFGGGPVDVIDLGNLNSHIIVPMINKAGRGTDFTYDLSYDSSVWYPLTTTPTTTWNPVLNWGWRAETEVSTGYIFFNTISSHKTNPPCNVTVYSGFSYHDPLGAPHAFSGIAQQSVNPGGGCTSQVTPLNGAIAIDGSGYSLYADGMGGAYVVSKAGQILRVPLNTGSGAATAIDRNGNQISANATGSFFDTLSSTVPVLTVSGAGTPTSPLEYTYTAPSGASPFYKVNYTNYTVATNFGISGISEYKSLAAVPLITSIVLPDGSSYSFSYEATPSIPASGACTPYSGTTCVTARIASVTLPTGAGSITYSYSGGNNGIFSDGSAATLTRTVSPGGTWTYTKSLVSGTEWQTKIVSPDSNTTVINFQQSANYYYETLRKTYQGTTGGTLLQTVTTCYNGTATNCPTTPIVPPITQRNVTTLLGNRQSLQNYVYNGYGLETEEDDYDYSSGTPTVVLRRIVTTYASLGNGIVNMPASVTICSGSGTNTACNSVGTPVAQTTFTYDQGTVTNTSGTPQHVAVAGARGNVTTILSSKNSSGTLSRTFTYYDTGMPNVATDVNGKFTTFVYANATSTCGNAFPTSITEPIAGLSRSFTWNCTGGVQTQLTDENSQSTQVAYTDPYYWRVNTITDALGNQIVYYYQPNPTYHTPPAVQWTMTFSNNSGSSVVGDLQYMDGLNRTYVDQHYQSPGSSTLDSISYTYDSNGRPYSKSMPCSIGGAGTCSTPISTTQYDALNRVLLTTDGGGGTVSYSYTANDVLVTLGPVPAGENAKKRQFEYNGLGELISVCEVTSGYSPWTGVGCGQTVIQTGYPTIYNYDPLGDLTSVSQTVQPSGTTQSRVYSYDWMGRLTSEMNPESGTTTYVYDSDSTCGTWNGDLVKRTDNYNNVTCYSYDALHRVLSKSYPAGPYASVTPSKYFVYDSASVNGTAMAAAKGRLAEAYTCSGSCTSKITDEFFGYTPRGELTDFYQSTPNSGVYYHSNATYWANGALNQLNGFSGATANYVARWNVDGEGRAYSNYSTGGNPLSATTYNAGSQPTQVSFSTGDNDTYGYDPQTGRMTQYQFNVNNQLMTGNLTWNSNGTLQNHTIQDGFNASNTQTCSFQHDDLVRLMSVNCPGNQLQNPGFEQGTSGWSFSGATLVTNASNAHSGTNYVNLSVATGGAATVIGPSITISPGDKITYGGWVNLQSGGGAAVGWTLAVFDANNNAITYQNIGSPGSPGWTYQTYTYTVPANGASAFLYVQVYQATGTTVLLADDGFLEDRPIWSQTFQYDQFGNIWKSGSMLFQATYSPTSNHILTLSSGTPTYDMNGNVTNDLLHSYSWDVDGNAISADGVTSTYDALDRQVEINNGGMFTQFFYSPIGFKMGILNGTTVQKLFVPLVAGSTAVYTGSGSVYYRHGDWQGSVRLTTTSTRALYYDGAYAPFGESYAQIGTSDVSYTGMDQDRVAGIYDFPARPYAYNSRWPSPDPAGLAAANPVLPQSWNRYSYVLGAPSELADPNGLYAVCINGESYDEVDYFVDGDYQGSDLYDLHGPCKRGSGTAGNPPPSGGGRRGAGGAGSGGTLSQIKSAVCSALPSGRATSVSVAAGGVGSVSGSADMVVNYNSGQTSFFATGGGGLGWNGGGSVTVTTGAVYGLDGTNNGFSGQFKGVNFYAPTPVPGVGAGGSITHGGGVTVVSVGVSGALAGKLGGGFSWTNTTNPLNSGKFTGYAPLDFLGYLMRRPCN